MSTPRSFATQESIYLFIFCRVFWLQFFFVYQYKEETDFYTPLDCESNSGEVMGNGEGKENKQG